MKTSQEEIAIIEVGAPGSPGVAIATTSFHTEYNKEKNLAKMKRWIEKAAGKGAQLVVFPEQCLQGYICFPPQDPMPLEQFQYQYENAETVPGPATDELTVLAKKHNLYIVIGMTERNSQYAGGIGALFNSMVLIGSEGVTGIYRKVHLPGNEHHVYVGGSGFHVYDTTVGRIGMNICHDKSFPETGRELMIKGTDIIVHSAAWPKSGPLTVYGVTEKEYSGYMSELMERHTAAANQVWFVSSNNFGADVKTNADFIGYSRIIHPSGIVIANSGEKEAIVVAHGLDIRGEIFKQRTEYCLSLNLPRDRVPSAYLDISKDLRYPPYVPEKGTTELYKE